MKPSLELLLRSYFERCENTWMGMEAYLIKQSSTLLLLHVNHVVGVCVCVCYSHRGAVERLSTELQRKLHQQGGRFGATCQVNLIVCGLHCPQTRSLGPAPLNAQSPVATPTAYCLREWCATGVSAAICLCAWVVGYSAVRLCRCFI